MTLGIVLVCISLRWLAAPAKAQADGEAPALSRWVVSKREVRVGTAVEAWLSLPARGGRTATVSIGTPQPARTWIVQQGACDPASTPAGPATWAGALSAAVVLRVCVVADEPGEFPIMATVDHTDAAGPSSEIVVSDSLIVRPWYHLGPYAVAVISTLAAFFTGLLAHVLQAIYQRRGERIKAQIEVEHVIGTAIASELDENRIRLRTFLVDPIADPPTLAAGAYNAHLKNKAVLEYLRARSDRFESIYAEIVTYERLVNQGAPDADIRSQAGRVLAAIEGG